MWLPSYPTWDHKTARRTWEISSNLSQQTSIIISLLLDPDGSKRQKTSQTGDPDAQMPGDEEQSSIMFYPYPSLSYLVHLNIYLKTQRSVNIPY
jgi:hypothetical protein